jgi:DUF971 family protein
MSDAVWPTELRLNPAKDVLTVVFAGGERFALPAVYLRVESPSAEVQGHAPGQKQCVVGKENVRIVGLEPVGNYAVCIVFDDGHDSGYFTWEYLFTLGREHKVRWAAYLDASAGM